MFKKLTVFLILLLALSNAAWAKNPSPGVNKFAWKAALQTINKLPLLSADPFGGLIITDWYAENVNTRYKVDVYVLSGILNAQSVKVSVFKEKNVNGHWVNDTVSNNISSSLENTILNLARKLRDNS